MNDESVQLIVALFAEEDEVEAALKHLQQQKTAVIHGAVGITKDENGRIQHKDVGMTPGKGAKAGLVLGATLGVLTGGAALALGALGGVVGTIWGKKRGDKQVPTEIYNWLVGTLKPGETAVLVITNPQDTAVLETELEALHGNVMSAELSPEMLEQLGRHEAAAYAALAEAFTSGA